MGGVRASQAWAVCAAYPRGAGRSASLAGAWVVSLPVTQLRRRAISSHSLAGWQGVPHANPSQRARRRRPVHNMQSEYFSSRPGQWRALDSSTAPDITSIQNDKVKFIRSLHKRRNRDKLEQVFIEGLPLVADVLQGGHHPDLVIITPEAMRAPGGPALVKLLRPLPPGTVLVASANVVQHCCDTTTPQGVVAVLPKPSPPPPDKINLAMVCDGVQDPGNVGTLARTCAGFGADVLILTNQCCDLWSPKALRASMGAAFRLPVLQLNTWADVRAWASDKGVQLVAADGNARAEYHQIDWTSPAALVVGAETGGLCEKARKEIDSGALQSVKIPLSNGVESLNAAMAGAIILSEARRQRHVSPDGEAAT